MLPEFGGLIIFRPRVTCDFHEIGLDYASKPRIDFFALFYTRVLISTARRRVRLKGGRATKIVYVLLGYPPVRLLRSLLHHLHHLPTSPSTCRFFFLRNGKAVKRISCNAQKRKPRGNTSVRRKSNAPLKLEIVIRAVPQRGSLSTVRKFASDLQSADNQSVTSVTSG